MVENKKTIYSFLGLPASGKGTQATMLAEKLGLQIVGVGTLVREEIKKDSNDPFVAEIKKRYEAGVPQTDKIAIDLIENYLKNNNSSVILDGFPFRESQADFLDKFVAENPTFDGPVVIYIKIDPETAIKRITTRKVCSECGAIFGASDEMICEKCGGALVVRTDDNEETMRNRIEFYLPRIKEIVDHYDKSHKVLVINGEQTIAEVSAEILKQL